MLRGSRLSAPFRRNAAQDGDGRQRDPEWPKSSTACGPSRIVSIIHGVSLLRILLAQSGHGISRMAWMTGRGARTASERGKRLHVCWFGLPKGDCSWIAEASSRPPGPWLRGQHSCPARSLRIVTIKTPRRLAQIPPAAPSSPSIAAGATAATRNRPRTPAPSTTPLRPRRPSPHQRHAALAQLRRQELRVRLHLPPPLQIPRRGKGKRVFVDFEGVMTASTVYLNGTTGRIQRRLHPVLLRAHAASRPAGENVLAVEVDSTERADIPPFGNEIDYLTFGGIYREVSLRIVPETFIDNIFAAPKNVLTASPPSMSMCFLDQPRPTARQPSHYVAHRRGAVDGDRAHSAEEPPSPTHRRSSLRDRTRTPEHTPSQLLPASDKVELWDLDHPHLYTVHVHLLRERQVIDRDDPPHRLPRSHVHRPRLLAQRQDHQAARPRPPPDLSLRRPGHARARAAPGRQHPAQATSHCNIVRTSHYPQSRHFLDACDEIGLLVLEEIPGWQHIGDEPWQDIAVDNVGRMIRRDWNHPSIILWGVRINESQRQSRLLHPHQRPRPRARPHAPDRRHPQLPGVRVPRRRLHHQRLRLPAQEARTIRAISTPNSSATPSPPRPSTTIERQREHTLRHARIHDQLASDPQYAGGIGWCAFDYNTHDNFGSGDRICYHGVMDIFREPKPAAGFYKSQCDPAEEIVLEPAFHWARNDESIGFTKAPRLLQLRPPEVLHHQRNGRTPPRRRRSRPRAVPSPEVSALRTRRWRTSSRRGNWGDLRIDGLHRRQAGHLKALLRRRCGSRIRRSLPDDTALIADGADTTRVVLRVNDEFGSHPPLCERRHRARTRRAGNPHRRQPGNSARGGVGNVDRRRGSSLGPRRRAARHHHAPRQTPAPRHKGSEHHPEIRSTRADIAGTEQRLRKRPTCEPEPEPSWVDDAEAGGTRPRG